MNLYKFIISFFISFFITINISYATEEFDKCVEEKIKEAGGDVDYVYQGVIIQLCRKETENKDNSNQ